MSLNEKTINEIVSIQNLDNINKLFNPIKSKGKLIKGPIFTAFNKQNLGSIPGKSENVILKEGSSIKKGFSSNTSRFLNRSETVKNNFPGPGTYSNKESNISNIIYSNKGYGNGFISRQSRFDDYNDYISKFKPGPSQYSENRNINNSINQSLLYSSLYFQNPQLCLKQKQITPGPGYYEIYKTDNNDSNTILNTENFFFKSSSKRFNYNSNKIEYEKENLIDKSKTDFNWKLDTQYTDRVNELNANKLFNETTEYEVNNKTEASSIKREDVKLRNLKNNISNRQSPIKEDVNILEKYGIIESHLKTEYPSINFNVFGSSLKKSKIIKPYEKFNSYQRNEFKKKLNINKPNKHVMKNDFYSTISSFNLDNKQLHQMSIFSSKSPRVILTESKIPGPCYYSPKFAPSNTSFNKNKNKRWLN